MPNIDPAAKTWEKDLAERFGRAVGLRRRALGLTAQELAQRTAELEYPITRVAISKIERNLRSGKVGVAEWLVLSQALEIPPVLLLFPDYPDGPVEGLPGNVRKSSVAASWISGTGGNQQTAGTDLIAMTWRRADGIEGLNHLDYERLKEAFSDQPLPLERLGERIRRMEQELEATERHIVQLRTQLWGLDEEGEDA